jgi:hypothetical protein
MNRNGHADHSNSSWFWPAQRAWPVRWRWLPLVMERHVADASLRDRQAIIKLHPGAVPAA